MSKMIKAAAALSVVAGLGVAALPLSSYAKDANLTVSANILSAISIGIQNSSGGIITTLALGDVMPGSVPTTANFKLVIGTNSAKGFDVTVQDADENNAMVHTADELQKIPAGSVGQGKTGWGVKGGLLTSFSAVPTSTESALPVFEYDESAMPQDGEYVIEGMTIGVSVAEDAGLKPGSYTDEIVFTALSK